MKYHWEVCSKFIIIHGSVLGFKCGFLFLLSTCSTTELLPTHWGYFSFIIHSVVSTQWGICFCFCLWHWLLYLYSKISFYLLFLEWCFLSFVLKMFTIAHLKKFKALADNFYIHVYALLMTGRCHFSSMWRFPWSFICWVLILVLTLWRMCWPLYILFVLVGKYRFKFKAL